MIGEVSFVVAGSGYRNRRDLAVVAKVCVEGERINLVREPANKFDPNAVQVWITPDGLQRKMLGYVPRDLAVRVAGAMDAGEHVEASYERALVDPSEDFDPIRFRVKVSA